ncbi:AAA family ATPase [Lysinibacillus xylanilyticus]|uniref:AAA family ATPase n=1 Tax=Lysinibacillus xylanilyticus TaxID=582475 RepID=UPI0038263A68
MYNNEELITHKIKVRVAKVLFYNPDSMWGIVSVVPIGDTGNLNPKLNSWGNFVMRGSIPMALKEKSEYEVELTDMQSDPKYGEYYEIVRVHIEALNTVDAQQRFLEAILTPYQYDMIIKEYPDCMILDMIKNNEVDITNVKGIGEITAKKIRENIERNSELGALMVELADLNLTGRMLNKIVDQFESSALALAKVKKSLYNLCVVSGISFDRVDKVALNRGEDKFGGKRIGAYAEYYFDEIANQGHSWADERLFLKQAIDELDINGKYIRDFLKTEDGEALFYWEQGDKRVSSKRMYNNERQTLKNLLRIASKYEAPIDIDFNEYIKQAEESLDVTYTNEQRDAIIKSFNHGVFILNGKGGTGKTTVVKGIVEVINALGLTYTACALSGKASQVLLSKQITSATIHRVFGLGTKKKTETGANRLDRELSIEGAVAFDVIIVDESSMVNAGIFRKVVEAIDNGSKIIIVGDSGQLSGIGHGDILRDLLQTQFFASIELQQIHRQAQDSGIIEVASNIRQGLQIANANLDGNLTFGVNKDMVVRGYTDREAIPTDLARVLKGHLKNVKKPHDLLDFQVVVAMKERGELSARSVNLLAQSVFNDLNKPFVTHNGYDFREGDKVIVKGNNYDIQYYDDIMHYEDCINNTPSESEIAEATLTMNEEELLFYLQDMPQPNSGDLFNGTMGIVVDLMIKKDPITDKEIKLLFVDFEGLGIKVFQQQELDVLELGYAVTCHRLQGSTIKNVVVALDYSAFSLLCRQWVYTAITRASKKCVLLVQSSALQKSIATDASGNRQTFLGDMIRELEQTKGSLNDILNKQIA